jgi:hypothetical protein
MLQNDKFYNYIVYKLSSSESFNNQSERIMVDILLKCNTFAAENNKVLAPVKWVSINN